jgi:hypothetical protein
VFKGLAYGLSLGSYRGGLTFPALFLGAAAGSWPPTYPASPSKPASRSAWAPPWSPCCGYQSAVVLATLLTSHAGSNVEPLIIVGVVVAYIITLLLSRSPKPAPAATPRPAPALAASSSR